MVASLLMLLCVFMLTWFAPIGEPFKIVLYIAEAVILALIILPAAGFRPVP